MFFAITILVVGSGDALGSDVPPLPEFATTVQPFLNTHCVKCHGPDKAETGLRLDQLGSTIHNEEDGAIWQAVLDALNSDEMPPEDERRPSDPEIVKMLDSLIRGLAEAQERLTGSTRVTVRRLNLREYRNTLKSLLGVDVLTDGLPEDGDFEGFDTVGQAQSLSALHVEQFLDIGREAIARSMSDAEIETQRIRVHPEKERNSKLESKARREIKRREELEKLPRESLTKKQLKALKGGPRKVEAAEFFRPLPGVSTGVIYPSGGSFAKSFRDVFTPEIPEIPGRYVLRFRTGLTQKDPDGAHFLEVRRIDTSSKKQMFSISQGIYRVRQHFEESQIVEVPFVRVKGGPQLLQISHVDAPSRSSTSPKEDKIKDGKNREGKNKGDKKKGGRKGKADPADVPMVWLDWFEIEGPLPEPEKSRGRKNIFFRGEPKGNNDDSYAKEIIERFTTLAFRQQQPEDEFLDKIYSIYLQQQGQGASFEQAITEALSVVLVSPGFFYLSEPLAEEVPRKLDPFEFAIRLSYFLWSAPPDEQLLKVAANGTLRQPAVLREQVDRLLDDPRSDNMVDSFTDQWLELERLDMIVVNKEYKAFSEPIRQSMRQEPHRFVGHLIKNNLSAINLVDSDFVVVDSLLAHYYGVPMPSEDGFHPVNLPENSIRGGIMGQGAILTLTSTGARTSPVERGAFILRKLLDDPPPPPPPNVPQLTTDDDGKAPIRERLALHAKKVQCTSCHLRMDPYGLALENFDPIGLWRSEVDGRDVDSTGTLLSGRRMTNPIDVKDVLMSQTEAMTRGVIRAVMTYGLGRPVGFADSKTLAALQQRWADEDYGMRTLIHLVVASEPFGTK